MALPTRALTRFQLASWEAKLSAKQATRLWLVPILIQPLLQLSRVHQIIVAISLGSATATQTPVQTPQRAQRTRTASFLHRRGTRAHRMPKQPVASLTSARARTAWVRGRQKIRRRLRALQEMEEHYAYHVPVSSISTQEVTQQRVTHGHPVRLASLNPLLAPTLLIEAVQTVL